MQGIKLPGDDAFDPEADAPRRVTDTRYVAPVAIRLGDTEQGVQQQVGELHLPADAQPATTMMEGKTLRAETQNGVTVARITARKLEEARQCVDFWENLDGLKDTKNLVIDFSGVEFIAGAFLNALIVLDKRMKSNSGVLKLAGMAPEIRAVFVITRLHKLFDICGTVEEAIARMNAPSA